MKSIESTEDFSAALRIVVGGAYVDGLNDRPHSTEAVKCTVRLLRETDATLRSEVAALREALREIDARTGHFGEAPPPEWMPMLSLIAWVGKTARAALAEHRDAKTAAPEGEKEGERNG